MFNTTQERDFIESVINRGILEEAVDWIQSNLEPEEVFDKEELEEAATVNDLYIDWLGGGA
jgi:hypothetical protein